MSDTAGRDTPDTPIGPRWLRRALRATTRAVSVVLGWAIIVVEIAHVIALRAAFDPLTLGIGVVLIGDPVTLAADMWAGRFFRRGRADQ